MRVMIFAERDFEDMELMYPKLRLIEAGFDVVVAGTGQEKYIGKNGYPVEVDGHIKDYDPDNFDALIVPGGWSPDRLRRFPYVLEFTKKMDDAEKLVACICHGGWVLISAGILKGRTMTCVSAIKDDITNAGAKYVNEEVHVDKNLISSRRPNDLPAFCREIVNALQQI